MSKKIDKPANTPPSPSRAPIDWLIYGLDQARYFVTALVALNLAISRSPNSLWCAAGGGLCGLAAKALKQIIKQPRPNATTLRTPTNPQTITSKPKQSTLQKANTFFLKSEDHGMPSSHTACSAFFASYAALSLSLSHHHAHPTLATQPLASLISITLLAGAGLVSWSRIRLGKHTTEQVLAGWALGITFAGAWWWVWIGTGLEGWADRTLPKW